MPVPKWFEEVLERELRPWLTLSLEQLTRLYSHYELLVRWNQRINLTSIEPGPQTVIRHYCESLFFGTHLPAGPGPVTIVDIGSGAGFPGIPMAVIRSDWRVTLVESNRRKAVFLREATRGWNNVSVLDQRAEEVAGTFDWAVSRAVDPDEVLLSLPRLAARIGLMLGEDDFSKVKLRSDIAWLEAVRLPWGDRRLCVLGMFHVTHVPRGT